MKHKMHRIVHLLSLFILCIGYILIRYVCFDIHGLKEWPLFLFLISIILMMVSYMIRCRYLPIVLVSAYILGFVVGVLFSTEGFDVGGGAANNLWVIWTVVYVCFVLSSVIQDGMIIKKRGGRFEKNDP